MSNPFRLGCRFFGILKEDGLSTAISSTNDYFHYIYKRNTHYRKTNEIKHRLPDTLLHRLSKWQGIDKRYKPSGIHYVSGSFSNHPFDEAELTKLDDFNPDEKTIYPTSNDSVDINHVNDQQQSFLGVGNVSSIDAVSRLDPSHLYFVDINPSQLAHLDLMIDLITRCNSRIDFISRFFGKSFSDVEMLVSGLNKGYEPLSIESKFWNCDDDKRAVSELHAKLLDYEYVRINGKRAGIRPDKYGSHTLGGAISIASFILNGTNRINSINQLHRHYPLYQKNGFLSSEDRYQHLKSLFMEQDWFLFPRPLSANFVHFISDQHPDSELHIWLANIFALEFWSKSQSHLVDKIKYLSQYAHDRRDIYVWQREDLNSFPNLGTQK